MLDAGKQPLDDLAREWWSTYAEPNLAPNGARMTVDTQGRLNHHGGLVVGPDGALYVANFSTAPDVGEVLKIVP